MKRIIAISVFLVLASIAALGQVNNPTTSAAPSGAAGGDLTGTYPNPVVANLNGTPFTTASTTAIGTSGATIPLLSTANTWTLAQTFSALPQFSLGANLASSQVLSWNAASGISSSGGATFQFGNGTNGNTSANMQAGSYYINGGAAGYWAQNNFQQPNVAILGWAATSNATGAQDTDLSRISAGVVGVGTGAQGSIAGALSLAKLTTSAHQTTQPSSGANLCGAATLSGTNWSGSGLGPYTHTSGTTALTSASCTALVAGQSYLLTYSMVAGGGGTVTPSFGGLTGSAQSTTATFTQYGTATGTTVVAFTPTNAFTGTVTLVSMVAQGPKATSCGTPVVVQGSTDYAGKLTTAVSGCVVTFQNAYTNAPACHFTADTAISTDPSQAVTNTTLTVTATGMTAFDYECVGLNE